MITRTRMVYQSAVATVMVRNKLPLKSMDGNQFLFSHSVLCRL